MPTRQRLPVLVRRRENRLMLIVLEQERDNRVRDRLVEVDAESKRAGLALSQLLCARSAVVLEPRVDDRGRLVAEALVLLRGLACSLADAIAAEVDLEVVVADALGV